MEICCEKCGNLIDYVSEEDFIILFKKKAQKYLCFECRGYNHPCRDCKSFRENDWFSNQCIIHKDNFFYLICLDKELEEAV
ncbi:hypothetical protein LCGC14_2270360 [marine sediment metagenome]|uniref:Uncharacterized protein n=1 Tax=marine sediment metagenome TaxID=412755 RepID=A0A0F9F9J8_9ZZZZ